MSYPRTYATALASSDRRLISSDWDAMINWFNGFTPTGTFTGPYKYIVSTDGTDTYGNNAFQTLYGGPSDTGGVDGGDAAAVIQACLDIADSVGYGGAVFIMNGLYTLTSGLTTAVHAGTTAYPVIIGESHESTILDGSGLAAPTYALDLSSTFGMANLANVQIKGGVKIVGGSNYHLRNVNLRESVGKPNLYVEDAHDSTIYDSSISYGDSGGMIIKGVASDPSDWRIINNVFNACDDYLLKLEGASTALASRGHSIMGNWFECDDTYPGHGIQLYVANDIKIVGNSIAGEPGAAFDLINIDGADGTDDSKYFKIIGNEIWAGGADIRDCLRINFAEHGIVSGNKFSVTTIGSSYQINETANATDNIISLNQFVYGNTSILGTRTILSGQNYGYQGSVSPALMNVLTNVEAALPFDEGTGASSDDWSGNSHNATLTNTTWTTGRFNNCLSFSSAASARATIADHVIETTGDFSIELWIKPSVVNVQQYMLRVLNAYSGVIQNNAELTFWVNTDGDNAYFTTNNAALQVNQWYHIVAVYDSSAMTIAIYKNGVECTYGTATTGTGNEVNAANTLYIGSDNTPANFYSGLIDNINYYNYALNTTQIAELASSFGDGRVSAGRVMVWAV